MDGTDLGLTLISIAEVPNFYSGLLPSLWTIAHFSSSENEEAHHWIRRGEIHATALSVAFGLGASVLTRSILPLVGTLAMSAILLYLYEHALHNGANAEYA